MLTLISLENGKMPLLEGRTCERADENGLLLSFLFRVCLWRHWVHSFASNQRLNVVMPF